MRLSGLRQWRDALLYFQRLRQWPATAVEYCDGNNWRAMFQLYLFTQLAGDVVRITLRAGGHVYCEDIDSTGVRACP